MESEETDSVAARGECSGIDKIKQAKYANTKHALGQQRFTDRLEQNPIDNSESKRMSCVKRHTMCLWSRARMFSSSRGKNLLMNVSRDLDLEMIFTAT